MINRATLLGILAILIWSSFTALIRTVSEGLGVTLGPALIYTVAAITLLATYGVPNIRRYPPLYLYLGGVLFLLYEVLLSLSVGMAKDRAQSLEISLINYLWPTFILLFSIWINHTRPTWLTLLGLLCSLFGVIWALSGEHRLNPQHIISNIKGNPLPYLLVFIAAIAWGLYCNIAKRFGAGENGIPLFFTAVALSLWGKFLLEGVPMPQWHTSSLFEMLIAGIVIGFSYTFWERAIQYGNMTLLANLSYLTPILSVLFSSLWLQINPSGNFWLGVILVTFGSLMALVAEKRAP